VHQTSPSPEPDMTSRLCS